MSPSPPKADIRECGRHVRFGHKRTLIILRYIHTNRAANAVERHNLQQAMLTKLNSQTVLAFLYLLVLLALMTGRTRADDEQVWAALKQGGKVILLRHTHVDIREGIGRLSPGNCAEE